MRDKCLRREEKECETEEELTMKEQIPNHLYCGVCRRGFVDYKLHISEKDHETNVKLQKHFWAMIDQEIDGIKNNDNTLEMLRNGKE